MVCAVGAEAGFLYTDYEDSLSFGFADIEQAQLELVWIDLARYQNQFHAIGLP